MMNYFNSIRANEPHRLWIGGHRGHASATRENTIANFAEVLPMGADYIEIDVQLTRDHQAMIFHDMELADRTPLKGYIRDYTVAELKAAFEIDTLEESLTWCKAHHLPVLLEVKSREAVMHHDMPILAERIVEALQKVDFIDECVVFGINHWILRRVRELDSRIHIALIVPHVPADPAALMKDMEADIYLCFIDNLSPELVRELHQAGYLVDGSVINSKERLKLALDFGCDMIESDTPDQAIGWYRELLEEAKTHA